MFLCLVTVKLYHGLSKFSHDTHSFLVVPRYGNRERIVTSKGSLYCIILILILILILIFQRCNKRVKGSLQAARLDLYVNGEILSPSDDKRLISQVPLRDRTVSIEIMKL